MTESDQLQPNETLVDRGTEDLLDEGISPPEKLRGSTAKGVTAEEEREGETIDERLRQEEPDPTPEVGAQPTDADEDDDPAERHAGNKRSGRLVEPDEGSGEDTENDAVARDVGIDGGAASAEEAAVHEVEQPDVSDDDVHGQE
jgi:hypothetical protein